MRRSIIVLMLLVLCSFSVCAVDIRKSFDDNTKNYLNTLKNDINEEKEGIINDSLRIEELNLVLDK